MPSGSSVGMLNNKWILYAVLFISIVDLFNFFSKGDTTAIMIFVVAGFLTTYFSKNMLVILVIALAITHIVRFGNASIEGMEGEDEEEEEDEDKVDEGMAGEAEGKAEGEAEEDKDEEKADGKKAVGKKAVGKKADGKEVNELQKIAESLKTMEAIHPDEAITKTETLINQTKMVQENMELLEPYLKQAEKVTKPLTKSEGFCDYSSAYKR
jgi:hypothetical protein